MLDTCSRLVERPDGCRQVDPVDTGATRVTRIVAGMHCVTDRQHTFWLLAGLSVKRAQNVESRL